MSITKGVVSTPGSVLEILCADRDEWKRRAARFEAEMKVAQKDSSELLQILSDCNLGARDEANAYEERLAAARLSMTMLENTRHEERQYRNVLEERVAELTKERDTANLSLLNLLSSLGLGPRK